MTKRMTARILYGLLVLACALGLLFLLFYIVASVLEAMTCYNCWWVALAYPELT